MARAETAEPGWRIAASIGLARPKDPAAYGYISEHHGYRMTEAEAGEYIGGERGITLPLRRSLSEKRGPLAVMHFDVDTWPDNFGQTYAHGKVFYHAIAEGLVDSRCMIQVGIRSPVERNVYDWTFA
jgi:arginase family enzyme